MPEDRTWTELEVYCEKMGWDVTTVTRDDVERISPKRYRAGRWDTLVNSPHIWKQCGICAHKFVVNNHPDGKSRTPRLAGFVVCVDCDPRHGADRYKKQGYRIIHHRRARLIKLAQITRVLATRRCEKKGKKKIQKGCKCVVCISKQQMGNLAK